MVNGLMDLLMKITVTDNYTFFTVLNILKQIKNLSEEISIRIAL